MDWFIFILITLAWITAFGFFLEKKTILRTALTGTFIVLFGASLLLTGISFPTGWTITTSGSVQTVAQTFTTYTIANNPWILGISWLLIFAGLYLILEVATGLFSMVGDGINAARNKLG